MKKAALLSIGMVLVLAMVATAGADPVVFNANFETTSGYVAGPTPPYNLSGPTPTYAILGPSIDPAGAGLPPGYYQGVTSGAPNGNPLPNAVLGQGGWAQGAYSSNPLDGYDPWGQSGFVVANPTAGAVTLPVGGGVLNSSSSALAVVGDSSGGPVQPTEIGAAMTLNTVKPVTLSFQAYYGTADNAGTDEEAIMSFLGAGFNFGCSGNYDSHGNTYGHYPLALTFGGVDYAVSQDAWHQFDITIDQSTSTASLSIGGTQVVTGVAVNLASGFGPADADAFSGLTRFNVWTDDVTSGSNANGTGVIYLDNMQVTQASVPVPEPATMTLLALGGLGVLLRRRK